MRPYESLIIFDAELEEPAIAAVLDRATQLVRSGGGERGPVDRWGKRTFAYEMRHKREGYYVVMEYTAEPSVAAEIDRVLHLADEVLRHKTIRLPDKIKGRGATGTPPPPVAAPAAPAPREAAAAPAPAVSAPVEEAPAPVVADAARSDAEVPAAGGSETD
jgi:small subunit ribosomal protein S6